MDGKIGLIFLFLLLGCLGEATTGEEPAAEPPPAEPATPSFLILNPENNQVLEGEGSTLDVALSLSTTNLLIRPPSSTNRVGEGHFVVQLDDGEPVRVFSKQTTLHEIGGGEHTLTVELVHNDNSPYNPPIRQTVRFIVQLTAPPSNMYEVNIHDFSYEPAEVRIHVGDRVTWTNEGNFPRTATSTGNFDSGSLGQGQSFTYMFNTPGTYEYFSVTYPIMRGTVIVE